MHVVGPLDIVDSQPSAQLTLLPGDVLKGVGGVNANIVNQGGTISPGDGPGTIFISAPISYSSASTYEVTIDGAATSTTCVDPAGCAGTYSSTVVTGAGNTFTAGGTIAPVLRGIGAPANNNYSPAAGTSFNVVHAAGGVLGSFSALTQPATGLAAGTRFDALYTANDINLYVTPANYQNLSAWNTTLNTNQSQVGGAINALRGTAGVRVSPTITTGSWQLVRPATAKSAGRHGRAFGRDNTRRQPRRVPDGGPIPRTDARSFHGRPVARRKSNRHGLCLRVPRRFGHQSRSRIRFGVAGAA